MGILPQYLSLKVGAYDHLYYLYCTINLLVSWRRAMLMAVLLLGGGEAIRAASRQVA